MVIYDAVIIGAGYWGASICEVLKESGRSVIVVDDEDSKSGTRNASAICDPLAYKSSVFSRYWPEGWDKSLLEESLSWLVEKGGVITEEYFWNLYQEREIRLRGKVIYLPHPDTISQLANPRITAHVRDIILGPDRVELSLLDSRSIVCRSLVIAAGYRSGELAYKLGVDLGISSLYGRGIIARGEPKQSIPVSVMIKPYTKHTVRTWTRGRYKIGDTAEENPSDKKLENLRKVGKEVLGNYREESISEGYRPVTSQFLVEKIAPRVIVATGGNRVALGVSKIVADKVLGMLK